MWNLNIKTISERALCSFPRQSFIFPSALCLRRPWPRRCHPRAMQRVSPQVGVVALLRCHSLALTGRACHTPSNSWYSSGFHIFQSAIRSDSICICCLKNDSEQAFAFAVQCLGGVLGASRRKRDLIYENMVTDDPSPCMILKIMIQECLGDEK